MILLKRFSFRGGIHPLQELHEGKAATSARPIREFVPETVCIPMDMHIGAPSKPLVKKGDKVKLGQIIAEAVGGIGIPVHASVSGEVTEVASKQMQASRMSLCITIQSDGQDEWAELEPLGDVEQAPIDRIIPAVRNAGICGLGGACFPTHAKMTPPKDKPIDVILLNGAECETFLTSDHRLMLEEPAQILKGLRAAMRAMGVVRGIVGIEDNKMDAYEAMRSAAQGLEGVEVCLMKTKYPQGGEKQLIHSLLKREVPSGGLPMDAGVVVFNVGTAYAIANAVELGKPCLSRVTTVTGCVKEPDNLRVRIGTAVQDAINACGGYSETPGKIFAGGSMTGICLANDGVSLTKANNGIVVLNEKEAKAAEETPCIRCGRCIQACPVGLNPYQMKISYGLRKLEDMDKQHVMDCVLCGACSYVCPARQYLTPAFKDSKEILATRRAAK